jgi:hypothetical protein
VEPLSRLRRAAARAARTAAATPGTRTVGPRPPAHSATRMEVPVATNRAPQWVSGARDGADMARVRGPAAAAHRLDESGRAPGRPLVGGSRGAAPGTQIPSCWQLQRRWSGRQRIGHPHACTQTRPLHAQAVCMAHAAGAHLHRFIEWVESVILKCSDAAWSTHLMSRCRIYRRQNHALDLLATASTCRAAPPNEHGESANSTTLSGVVGGAKWCTPSGRQWHATSGT